MEPTLTKKLSSYCLGLLFAAFMVTSSFAQQDFSSMKDVVSDSGTSPDYSNFQPLSIHSHPNFFDDSTSPNTGADIKGNPGGVANVISLVNFQGSFTAQGQTWPFTMVGNDPVLGHKTEIPAHIVAVSLELQNADLTTTTVVPVAKFEQPTLNSPVFRDADYTSGNNIQFTDAVQRAEFFNHMKQNWHTELDKAAIADRITIQVPRFVTLTIGGKPTQVRTYFTGTAADGSTFVLLLSNFFNQQIFNIVNNAINAGHYTTDALNIALFPNTFLFSANSSGGIGSCCTLGFHTYFTDGGTPKESRWAFAYASWISPGLFGAGFEDVTALSHEVAEAFNDPFVNNAVPAWVFPGQPGTCQANLETGDPVEVLQTATVSVPTKVHGNTFTYHPQTEALLQWFEQGPTSDALGGAFSYPDTSALTTSAVPFGKLTCR
jgi:hypothetical protein